MHNDGDTTPDSELSTAVLRRRYLQPGERTSDDVLRRVAAGLAQAESPATRAAWERRFLDHLRGGAIGAGRIMAGCGVGRGERAVGVGALVGPDALVAPDAPVAATWVNCFVQGLGARVEGRDEPGKPGVEEALRQTLKTLAMGGGVGLDLSSSPAEVGGPCGVLDRLEAGIGEMERGGVDGAAGVAGVSGAVGASGVAGVVRSSAVMAVLPVAHPALADFIAGGTPRRRWPHVNRSVAVDDAFMEAARNHPQGPQGLQLQRLARAAARTGEPGLLFIDRIRCDDNLRALETLSACNPCGEQPLPDDGACVLGPLVLPRFVRHPFGVDGTAALNFRRLREAAMLQVRMLDNVIDLTPWPWPQQARQATATRRIGVGFTGLADALILLGLRYDTAAARDMAARVARCLRDACYAASIALARERGAFPAFSAQALLQPGTFASRLPRALRQGLAQHGLRNSHLLAVAPCGSVTLAFADNASTGIEPVQRCCGWRHLAAVGGGVDAVWGENAAWRRWQALKGGGDPPAFITAQAVAPEDHLAMVAAVQPFVDAGISKTVNLRPDRADDVASIGLMAWALGLKGVTVYVEPPGGAARGATKKNASAA